MRIRPVLSAAIVPLLVVAVALPAPVAHAMCGCMLPPRPPPNGEVKRARIINKSSKVILARDGDTTVLTMANDFEGAPADFGLVVPVPSVVRRSDVKVIGDEVFTALEDLSAPRITEVFEPDPCGIGNSKGGMRAAMAETAMAPSAAKAPRAADFGVKVESHFFAGEYEIAVLSGKDGSGLIQWLQLFNYDIPDDAKAVLESYIKQKMMFFLARVHIKEMGTGLRNLRPLQVRYTTPKLMLPVRLGMVNADGPQELMVFALAKGGRIEATNYRTVKMPTDAVLPLFAKDAWSEVYGAMFTEQTKREDMRVVFLEGVFPGGNAGVYKKAGAFWDGPTTLTRVHFRYQNETFPEDLVLQTTFDQAPFAVRMTAMHPPDSDCGMDSGAAQRRAREQQTLANLTGWPIETVRQRMGFTPPPIQVEPIDAPVQQQPEPQPQPPPPQPDSWWKRIWR